MLPRDIEALNRRVSIKRERERVERLPQGSLQRLVGQLWVDWLEHMRVVRIKGLVQHIGACPEVFRVSDFEKHFPWTCCVQHGRLTRERENLIERARDLGFYNAPHQDDTPFTTAWWGSLGYHNYHPDMHVSNHPPGDSDQ